MKKHIEFDRLRREVIRIFAPFDPERIIVFGSRARDQADEESDVDVLVVYETEKRFLDRLEELYLLWDLPLAVDILAYTPSEFREMMEESAFVQDVVREGRTIVRRETA